MRDTDWRPSRCPHCGEWREAREKPICQNPKCTPKSRSEQLCDLLRRPFGNLTEGEKAEVADRIAELEAKLAQYKSAITYAAIVVDQVANDEDVDPNALMAALLEIEVVAPKKLEDQTDE